MGLTRSLRYFEGILSQNGLRNRDFGQKIKLPLFSGDPLFIGLWEFRQCVIYIFLFLFLNKGHITRLHFNFI